MPFGSNCVCRILGLFPDQETVWDLAPLDKDNRALRMLRSYKWQSHLRPPSCALIVAQGEMHDAQAITVFLFVVFAAFPALAANPTDDLKKADQDWAQAAGSKNVDQFMSFIADDSYVSGPTAGGCTVSRK